MPGVVVFKLLTPQQMREVEARAAERGVDEQQLQHNAARAIAGCVASRLSLPSRPTVVVAAGPGNNGRDAVLAGQHLRELGARVLTYLSPRHSMTPAELSAMMEEGIEILLHDGEPALARLQEWLKLASATLDGLLGIGVRGPMREPLASIAEAINAAKRSRRQELTVFAVDVPSGIDSETGAVPGTAVRADITLALGSVKTGTVRFPAAELAGEIVPLPIGLPPGITEDLPVGVLTAEVVSSWLPKRPLSAHKDTFGRVLIVGGSRDYIGAPLLSGAAAARSGAGVVALAVPLGHRSAAAAFLPEAVYFPVPSGAPEEQAERLCRDLLEVIDGYRAVVLGPGLGRSAGAVRLVSGFLSGLKERLLTVPVVVDGDGLYALTTVPRWWEQVPATLVLTPHYGEMARLTGLDSQRIAADPWGTALAYAKQWRQTVVLKGPFTTVAVPDGKAWTNIRANPALATAGTGDVLSGLIAGFISQGTLPHDAASLAVLVHSYAAVTAQEIQRRRTILASDLLPAIPTVLQTLAHL